ncbi:DUF4229 domain-containing protein [Streptomyces sp.]|jgi:hypothetical protein
MLRYTLLRLGLFVGCSAVIWGLVYVRVLPAGLGSSNLLWVMLLALVISAPLSFVLLRGAREAAAAHVSQRVERARRNFEATASHEDAADDAARAAQS